MAKQVGKRFAWVIKDFSSLQSERVYSVSFVIGDCKWRLCAYPKGRNINKYLSLFLEVVDFESLPSGWSRYVKMRLTVVKQKRIAGLMRRTWSGVFQQCFPLPNLRTRMIGFSIVNGELMIVANVEVVEVIGTLDESESLSKMKLDDGEKSSDSLNQTKQVKESIDVNGFQVLPSQVENVRSIFERHPDIAVEFRAKNQHLRKACVNFLLSLIETMCQSLELEELSNEDLVEADIALTYVKDAGFKVDWLEKKLEEVKEKKEKEQSDMAQLQEMEDNLLKLKQNCSNLDALVEKKKDELSVTRSPLSFDDVV
ncbi:unnamed protein product [Arabidopsis halleri]